MSKVTILTKPNRIVIASKGVQGPAGPEGPEGIQGIQGEKGDTGDVTPEAIAARDDAIQAAQDAAGEAGNAADSAGAALSAASAAGQSADAASQSADAASAAAEFSGNLFDLDVAVPYASGLNVDSTRFTVIRDGQVYAPAVPVPFTTGAWNPAQWNVIQGDINLRSDLADPTGGAGLVAFRQRGEFAVPRTSEEKAQERVSPEDFGAVADWSDDTQTGTDCTMAFQRAIDYCRENGVTLEPTAGPYRIAGPLNTQGNPETPFFKAFTMLGSDTRIVADFSGDVALLLRGGGQYQTVRDVRLEPSLAHRVTSGFDGLSHGVEARNCRADIDVITTGFKGGGTVITCTAPNSNGCSYRINASDNGRGVIIQGSSDNLSVSTCNIRARGNREHGIYVDPACRARGWECFWYAENNWLDNPVNTNYGVDVGGMRASSLIIYSEQANNAREIIFRSSSTGNLVRSQRRNKDVIAGDNMAWAGRIIYQQPQASGPDLLRQSEPLIIRGETSRVTGVGEWVRVPFQGSGVGSFGGIKGEQRGMQLYSDAGTEMGIWDGHATVGPVRKLFGQVELDETTPSITRALFASAGVRPITGVLHAAGSNDSGARHKILSVPFYVVAGALSLGTPFLDVEAESTNDPNYTLEMSGSTLQLTVSYTPTPGQTHRVGYHVELLPAW